MIVERVYYKDGLEIDDDHIREIEIKDGKSITTYNSVEYIIGYRFDDKIN